MKIVSQAAWLLAFLSVSATASAAPSPTPSLRKAERVYEYGQQLTPSKTNAPSSSVPITSVSPAVVPASRTTTYRPAVPSFQYEMILTVDTSDVRVVRFNEATCVSLDSCLPGGNVVNVTWTDDLGSPNDNMVTFYSDRDCRTPITTELPSPASLDFSAHGEAASPRSFSVGEWFIDFDYPSHLVEPCTVDGKSYVL